MCACVLCSSHEYIVPCITEHVEFFPKEILSELIANEDVCVCEGMRACDVHIRERTWMYHLYVNYVVEN